MSLHPVVGHKDFLSSMARAHERTSLPSSLLLHGPRGVGKQRVALWIAQLTICERPAVDGPCEKCGACRMAVKLEHPDVHWYFPLARPKGVAGDRLVTALEDARMQALEDLRAEPLYASHTADVRGLYFGITKTIRRQAHLRPNMAPGQVFIIGNAELLVPQEASPEAANALLKLLEEPPGTSRFILTSSEPGRLLPTILSRTVALHVAPLGTDLIDIFLSQQTDADRETTKWACELSQGSIGRALGFLPDGQEKGPLESLRRQALALIEVAVVRDPGQGYELSLSYPSSGARALIPLCTFIEEWLRDLGAIVSGAGDRVFNFDERSHLQELVARTSIRGPEIVLALTEVEQARELARGNVNPQLIINGLVRNLRRRLIAT